MSLLNLSVLFLIISNFVLGQTQNSLSYFPLHIGDKWTLSNQRYALEINVLDTVHINSKVFYDVKEVSSESNTTPLVNKRLYSLDSHGNVVRRIVIPDSSDISKQSLLFAKYIRKKFSIDTSLTGLWYKINANVNDAWRSMANSQFESREIHLYKITLESRTDTVKTANHVYYHCLRFYINDLQESDTEYWDWLAIGVGLVKRVYFSPKERGFVLIKAELK